MIEVQQRKYGIVILPLGISVGDNMTTIPIIVSIVYVIIEILKILTKSENFKKIIPLASAVIGGGLGVIIYFIEPDIMPNSLYSSLITGISSGLSAVGINQIYKQSKKG